MPKVESRPWRAARCVGIAAEQHVGNVPRAEALAGAIDAGQRLLRGTVPSHTRGGFRQLSQLPQGCSLAEVIEQPDPAAAGGFG